MGIGPTLQPWEGRVLPLYYARSSGLNPTAAKSQKYLPFVSLPDLSLLYKKISATIFLL